MGSASPSPEDPFGAALDVALGSEVATAVLAAVAETPGAAFVGGWVRDVLRGVPSTDVDLVAPDPDTLAARLGRPAFGRTVVLDAKRRTLRVVIRGGGYLDVAAQRGGSLEADLRARDFTLNAVAWSPSDGVVDPTGGVEDARRGLLRLAGPDALHDDPLRALRALRLAAVRGLTFDRELPAQLRRCRLDGVAPERIQRELASMLQSEKAGDTVLAADWEGALESLPGRIDPQRLATLEARPWPSQGGIARCHAAALAESALSLVLGRALCAAREPLPVPQARDWLRRGRWRERDAQPALTCLAAASTPLPAVGPPSLSQRASLLVSWRNTIPWGLLGLTFVLDPHPGAALVDLFLQDLDPQLPLALRGGRPVLPAPCAPLDPVVRALGPGPWLAAARIALLEAQIRGDVRNRSAGRTWLLRWIAEHASGGAPPDPDPGAHR
jgi:hypothetical protein